MNTTPTTVSVSPWRARLAAVAALLAALFLAGAFSAVPAHAATPPTTVEMTVISAVKAKAEPSPYGDAVADLYAGQRVLASTETRHHDGSGIDYRFVVPADAPDGAGGWVPTTSLAFYYDPPTADQLTVMFWVPDPATGPGIWGGAAAGAMTSVSVYSAPHVDSGSVSGGYVTPGTFFLSDGIPVLGDAADGLFGTRPADFLYVQTLGTLPGQASSIPYAGYAEKGLLVPVPDQTAIQAQALPYTTNAPLETFTLPDGQTGPVLPAGSRVELAPAVGSYRPLLYAGQLLWVVDADFAASAEATEDPTEDESADIIDRTQERCLEEGWTWCDGVDDEETGEPTEDPTTVEPTEDQTDDEAGWVDRLKSWWDEKTDTATEVATRPARIATVAAHTGAWLLVTLGIYAAANVASKRALLTAKKGDA